MISTTIVGVVAAERQHLHTGMHFRQHTNTTCPHSDTAKPSSAVGYLCSLVAVIFFGSNFVPVKKFETGDGIFFQWVLCNGIFIVGNFVNVYRNFPTFEPIAMIGGSLWALGNIMSVPIIKLIGLSLGLLIWGSTNMIVGWASGTFGLFGLKANPVADPGV